MHDAKSALLLGASRPDAARRVSGDAAQAERDAARGDYTPEER
jgi:hypothetical protein